MSSRNTRSPLVKTSVSVTAPAANSTDFASKPSVARFAGSQLTSLLCPLPKDTVTVFPAVGHPFIKNETVTFPPERSSDLLVKEPEVPDLPNLTAPPALYALSTVGKFSLPLHWDDDPLLAVELPAVISLKSSLNISPPLAANANPTTNANTENILITLLITNSPANNSILVRLNTVTYQILVFCARAFVTRDRPIVWVTQEFRQFLA